MINEALNIIRKFLKGEYDLMDFSYDLPDFLVSHYDDMYAENPKVTELLNDNIPEICADYEDGYSPEDFRQRIKTEYTRAIRKVSEMERM